MLKTLKKMRESYYTTSDIQEYKKRIFMNVHERLSFLGTFADIRKRSRERS